MATVIDVKERPILFNGEMVRAILDGRKAQTRRVVKQPINHWHIDKLLCDWPLSEWLTFNPKTTETTWRIQADVDDTVGLHFYCPYGQVGDRLWVRETFLKKPDSDPDCAPAFDVKYKATDNVDSALYGGWKPSIHMPRWASRINLEITDVRVERVKDINEEDALFEGVSEDEVDQAEHHSLGGANLLGGSPARCVFASLWNSINADRGFGWDVNPWVWALTFKRVD